ncbi:MAG: hypothetical protein AAB116_09585 [Candidatus Poribacteria bacterium]
MSNNNVLLKDHPKSVFATEINEDISEEDIMIAMQEHELIIRIIPIKKYKIRVKVKSIKKASPRVIEPEGIDGENTYLV